MQTSVIAPDDPRAPDVRQLLERHLALMNAQSPPEDVHALDVDGLVDRSVTFVSLRSEGVLLGVAALKQRDATHAEVKSMHTAEEARGRGVGRALLDHLLGLARERGLERVSLETGSQPGFAPARALYARAGFAECGPFADYLPSPHSTFMTRVVDPRPAPVDDAAEHLVRTRPAPVTERA
ncbi:GNAT family N-acetyltransferase [Cellulomonas cellasea]|uniref:Putative acetyltransferase n=1 Tax=Cellulomonas cellasea TaxID=43670 RepID=A0A7W4UBL7_9CELL|nr:GNAT family N-acetyltransferase [Cellulomonas cellasea]MBB2921207.1 putative acetyltransferase [Cellulomonas cellasea]